MSDEYAKVKKGALEDSLTCPLCFQLFREATTINECLHTFCKECIHQKLEEDNSNCCPLCNVYLGCKPLDKLKADNNKQAVIQACFLKKQSRDLKNTSTIKKKERSLSSLADTSTKRKPGRPCKAGRSREKVSPKMPRISQKSTRKLENEKDMTEEKIHLGQSSSLKCSTKSPIVYKKQRISGEEGPSQVAHTIDGPLKNLVTSWSGKDRPAERERLSVLKETGNGKKELHAPLLSRPAINMETNNKLNMRCTRNMKRGALESIEKRMNTWDLNKSLIPEETPEPTSNGGLELIGSREQILGVSAENESGDKSLIRLFPFWLKLLAHPDKNDDPYPQLPKPYINIKDGRTVKVSIVNKYLVQKLNLRDGSEVEVMCCGQKLDPDATLYSLVDMWLRSTSKANESVGTSKSDVDDFVMVFTYGRK